MVALKDRQFHKLPTGRKSTGSNDGAENYILGIVTRNLVFCTLLLEVASGMVPAASTGIFMNVPVFYHDIFPCLGGRG
jgi:hypothetical protein